MGDTLTQKVTQRDATDFRCVALKTLMQWEFTAMVTQVTQFCKEVVTRARVWKSYCKGASLCVVRHLLDWMNRSTEHED